MKTKTANDVEYHLNQAIEIAKTTIEKGIGYLTNQINDRSIQGEDQLVLLFNTLPFE